MTTAWSLCGPGKGGGGGGWSTRESFRFLPQSLHPWLRQSVFTRMLIMQVMPTAAAPALLMTTACVLSGASGGAVVDARGRLAGLVTSNARLASGALAPHLNFCVPAARLRAVVELTRRAGNEVGADFAGSSVSRLAVPQEKSFAGCGGCQVHLIANLNKSSVLASHPDSCLSSAHLRAVV